MTGGTLASNGVGRGHNLYAVLRATAASTAVPAYTCSEFWSGTVPVNHGADFPGQITCGCAKTGEHADITAEPLCRMCKAPTHTQYWAYRVDGQCQCVQTTGAGHTDCLAKGTCAPDPTCAPTIDVAGTTFTEALEGVAWVAKDWSGAAKCGGDPDPYDDERIIKIAHSTIYFVNGGGGGPYYGVESLSHSDHAGHDEEMEFYLVSETELKVRFGYKKPATIIYKRTHWHAVEDEDCGYDVGFFVVYCGDDRGAGVLRLRPGLLRVPRLPQEGAGARGADHRRPARRGGGGPGGVAEAREGPGDRGVAQGRPRRRHRRVREVRTSLLCVIPLPSLPQPLNSHFSVSSFPLVLTQEPGRHRRESVPR